MVIVSVSVELDRGQKKRSAYDHHEAVDYDGSSTDTRSHLTKKTISRHSYYHVLQLLPNTVALNLLCS